MSVVAKLFPWRGRPPIKDSSALERTDVDAYWSEHTVNSKPFRTAEESIRYLQWRNEQYPLFPEFMEMWGRHTGQTVLDYGCGPGNDVVGFLIHGDAARVVGVDVSPKALDLARQRVALHRIRGRQVDFIRISDAQPEIPLPDASVNYINCGGVLHHVSNPEAILAEFRRILKPGVRGRIMVYNRQSLWFHLYVAYARMIVEGKSHGLSTEEAFRQSTDGERCPVSVAYRSQDFLRMLEGVHLQGRFIGGYLSLIELACWHERGKAAIEAVELPEEHRAFLSELEFDANGYPKWQGKYAGIGGSYEMWKAEA